MADGSYNTKVYEKQGGAELVVSTGGQITLDGGAIKDASGNTLLDSSGAGADLAPGSVATAALAAGAVTPAKMSFTGIKQIKVTGHNEAGACTATGAAVGDRVLAMVGAPAAGGDLIVPVIGTDFEATITVINQIQQASASDLHLDSFLLLLIPAAA